MIEDLIEKAKGKVITEKQGDRLSYLSQYMKPFSTITQRYGFKPARKESKKFTKQDIFDTFDAIQYNSWLVYGIMKAVMDGLRHDDKLPEIDLIKGGYTAIIWKPSEKKSGDVTLLFEKHEEYVEITFFLHSMYVKFNLSDNYTRVECFVGGLSGLESLFNCDTSQVPEEYNQFAVYLAKAIPTLALLNV